MPSTSAKQQRLVAAVEHGATFPKAREVRASMSPEQLREFAKAKQSGAVTSHSYNWRQRAGLKRGAK